MKRAILLTCMVFTLLISGCGDDKTANLETKKINVLTQDIKVGEFFKNITIKDQFDKPKMLSGQTKKIIFVFTKKSGHTVKELLDSKSNDYLSKKNIAFIADISGMPSIIANMFAIPDLKKHKYSIMLIRNEDNAKKYENEKYKDYIIVVGLNNFKITSITLVGTAKNLEKIIG